MCSGCKGKLPNSVLVRMEAARIAAPGAATPDELTRRANAVFSFLIAGLGEAGEKSLDAEPERRDVLPGTGTAEDREAFVNGPLAQLLTVREAVIDALERMGIATVGSLAQAPAVMLKELHVNDFTRVDTELRARGLTFDMTTDQLRQWITRGSYGPQKAHRID